LVNRDIPILEPEHEPSNELVVTGQRESIVASFGPIDSIASKSWGKRNIVEE
jgi:hypothetical protein